MRAWHLLVVISYVLAGAGVWALIKGAGALAAIGVVLLIWANNVYELTKRE